MSAIHLALSMSFVMGATGLVFNRTHLLSALLCLEAMMLSLYLLLAVWSLQTDSANFSAAPMFLLAFSACEASTGLALMVALTRTHGCDHVKNFNLLRC
uniref:NADH-ubiquinone oxidoreductase chain 4L n=1 Tax=Psenopsis anomala TaxID=163124 RepID=R9RHT0_PSEAK|nr:NADH dehydrogenase subunit 4L [Psenopsis anomala]AGM48305.1 NADH dehydrogenase subunit 4L [Psenopsis anomala]BAX03872.1 NADH dehydrogenase subunit 4L [Psenopsis anomala]BBU26197.1 NADH dehydrogenase subunit 4L [Psenopsis anomala]